MKSSILFISSMTIFGTIGLVVRQIPLASSERALLSSMIGCVFLLCIFQLSRQKMDWGNVWRYKYLYLFASIALAGNWIFLYKSYDYTTIANATLGYYFAPVFVLLSTPLLFKQKLIQKKVICIFVALLGLVLIVLSGLQASSLNDLKGLSFGLIAALFYGALLLINQFIQQKNRLEMTIIQLALSAMLLMPYVYITEGNVWTKLEGDFIGYIFILGIVNTGIGFWLFFAGMRHLSNQSIAALSYVDPLVAILISAIILQESITALQIIGAILLLGATFVSEYPLKQRTAIFKS